MFLLKNKKIFFCYTLLTKVMDIYGLRLDAILNMTSYLKLSNLTFEDADIEVTGVQVLNIFP